MKRYSKLIALFLVVLTSCNQHTKSEDFGLKTANNLDVINKECLENLLDYSAVILAVPHEQFFSLNINGLKQSKTVFYDLKGVFSQQMSDGRL